MAPAGGCWGGAVAAAGAARCVPVLLLLGVLSARRVPVPLLLLGVLSAAPRPGAQASEHYTPLSLLKQELQHRQQQEAPAGGGCSPQSGDWGDQHSAECAGECAARRGSAGPAGPRGLRVPQVPPTPARRVLPARQPAGCLSPRAASRLPRPEPLWGRRRGEELLSAPGASAASRSPGSCWRRGWRVAGHPCPRGCVEQGRGGRTEEGAGPAAGTPGPRRPVNQVSRPPGRCRVSNTGSEDSVPIERKGTKSEPVLSAP